MIYDFARLRKDLVNDSLGAYFGGGFGGAMIESFDIERASDDELLQIARQKGIDPDDYILSYDDED